MCGKLKWKYSSEYYREGGVFVPIEIRVSAHCLCVAVSAEGILGDFSPSEISLEGGEGHVSGQGHARYSGRSGEWAGG